MENQAFFGTRKRWWVWGSLVHREHLAAGKALQIHSLPTAPPLLMSMCQRSPRVFAEPKSSLKTINNLLYVCCGWGGGRCFKLLMEANGKQQLLYRNRLRVGITELLWKCGTHGVPVIKRFEWDAGYMLWQTLFRKKSWVSGSGSHNHQLRPLSCVGTGWCIPQHRRSCPKFEYKKWGVGRVLKCCFPHIAHNLCS